MGGTRVGVALVVGALVLAACSGDDDDGAGVTPSTAAEPAQPDATRAGGTSAGAAATTATMPPIEAAPWHTPTLTDRQCPTGHPAGARCSTFTVAADRSDRTAGTIDLPVVVFPAVSGTTGQAVVIPSGGPGYPGTTELGWAGGAFNEAYDIVLYDQRGTGGAIPSLECAGVDAAFVAALQRADDYTAERDAMAAARADCLAALEAKGVDLTDYHSEASAADLDELRQALGYQQWNILGVSYGARLALATMRSYPAGIRAVILDSVYDVTAGGLAATVAAAERAVGHLAEACSLDDACAGAHGDLAAKIEQTRQRYNGAPAVIEVDAGAGLQSFVVTGDDMLSGLFTALYDSELIPLLPSAIDGLLAGDTGLVPLLIQRGIPFSTGFADAMAMAVNCADNAGLGVERDDAAVYEDPRGFGLVVGLLGLCPRPWTPTAESFNEPVVSDIPALVLAGSYDPITPPEGTQAVADRLTNATFVLVEPAGHGATNFDECVAGVELAFLADPSTPPDTRCVKAIPVPAFG